MRFLVISKHTSSTSSGLGNFMTNVCRILPGACIVVALIISSGCGSTKDNRPRRVPVNGTVLRMGQPVAEAEVIFEPVGNTPAATGETDPSGRFRLTTFDQYDGAAPGEYKVAVRKVQITPSHRPPDAPDDLVTPPPEEKWLLPVKYGHTVSSGLTATVKADGENDFRFELPD
jgi:hypothetical protein